jgi:hypothetical protein
MRLSRSLFQFLLLSGIVFFGIRIHALINLFFAHSGIGLTQQEIKLAYEHDKKNNVTRKEEIPRIIHQIFHDWKGGLGKEGGNETLPGDWDEVRRGCKDNNPGWEYHVCLHLSIFLDMEWFRDSSSIGVMFNIMEKHGEREEGMLM